MMPFPTRRLTFKSVLWTSWWLNVQLVTQYNKNYAGVPHEVLRGAEDLRLGDFVYSNQVCPNAIPPSRRCLWGASTYDVRVQSIPWSFSPPPLPCPALSKLLYRVAHLLANVGWVDFVLGCSTTLLGPAVGIFSSAVAATTHRVLTRSRVRTPMSKGNQIHSSTLWSLRFPKMYMATLGYKGNVLHYKYRVVQSFKSETFPL